MNNMNDLKLTSFETEMQSDFKNEALRHQDALYHYALKIVQNADDAQDLLQDTYYKAYKNYHQFEKGTNSKAWMFMILKNTFINNYRKNKREPVKVNYDEIENLYENLKSEQSGDNNLELDIYKNMFNDEISDAVDSLPIKMKEVFLLCDLEGYSYEEIAEIIDVPIGTVRSRLHRARKILQSNLFEYAKINGYLN
jgi:RNA polymerase sigma-70 factor, ECF subfamily